MKRITKKIAALALALVTALTAVPLTAQAAVSAPTQATIYRTASSANSAGIQSFSINGLSKSDKIKNIKSSNTSVAEPYSVQYGSSSWSEEYLDSSTTGYSSSDYYANIEAMLLKAGSTKISYTIGKKKYTTKVTVKNYTNPLESFEISGVKNGKNLASLANKSTDLSSQVLTDDQKNATVTISAKSGWVITYAALSDNDNNTSYSIANYSKGLSSATLHVGTLKKTGHYYVYMNLQNKKDGGTLYLYLSINPNAK
jgi:hypothetical protein